MSPAIKNDYKAYDKIEIDLLDLNDSSNRIKYVATFLRYLKNDKVEIQVNSVNLVVDINRIKLYNDSKKE